MDRTRDRERLVRDVYGENAGERDTAPARALHEVVPVDLAVTGCPIEKHEILAAVAHLLNGDPPPAPATPVCAECRMRENNCLLVETGTPCLGPVTAGGCHARCPDLGIPCVGCRGPAPDSNIPSALAMYAEAGTPLGQVVGKLGTFAPLPAAVRAGIRTTRK
jgi:sulfhydrogenase subunit delta